MLGVYGLNLALMGRTEDAVSFIGQSINQPNTHYHVNAWAAVTHALDGQLRKGAEHLSKARAVNPGYSIEDFFGVFKFQQHADIARIEQAFRDLEPYMKQLH